jgi:hypothetical protein
MTPEQRAGGTWWRPWFAPLVVALALAVDYGSPEELWTAAIPLVFMAFLLSFRERAAALAVLLLSSWIAIPLTALVFRSADGIRGIHRVDYVRVTARALETDVDLSHCNPETHVSVIEIDGRRPLVSFEADVADHFAYYYNRLAGTSIEKDCRPPTTAQAPASNPPQLDEMVIYNRALSADEIHALATPPVTP